MDPHKLRSHVFDKTGIKVDTDDPIFALVALNEAVLAETVERQLAVLNAATDALAAQACAAGGLPPPATPVTVAMPATRWFTPREWRLLGAAAIVSLACALLVLGGAALLWHQP
ncbi:hypothetical protein [Janthinobacterium psychrotolerans]|uniref:hypothetical protein n=1 Tax=Janthinobacterium psychrotolerans TaxID=1747903 RepID=UPI00080675E9|nr:hypothetical protein [Janthinobacterium psychrotolerans]